MHRCRTSVALFVATVCCGMALADATVAGKRCAEAGALLENEGAVARATMKPLLPPARSSKPLPHIHAGGCDVIEMGWWSYEFCPGKWIRQFHKEHEAVASEFYLGFGSHALTEDAVGTQNILYRDHTSTIVQQVMRDDGLRRGASLASSDVNRARCRKKTTPELPHQVVVDYVGGTVCDATTEARRTAVVYVCAREPLFTWNITERNCVYTAFVVGRLACSMMQVSPPQRPEAERHHQQKPTVPPPSAMDVRPHPNVRRKLQELADLGGEARIPNTVQRKNDRPAQTQQETPSEQLIKNAEENVKRAHNEVLEAIAKMHVPTTDERDDDVLPDDALADAPQDASNGADASSIAAGDSSVLDERGEPFDFGDAMIFSV